MSTYYNGFLEETEKQAKQNFEKGNYDEAEKYYLLSMKIHEEGVKRNPEGWNTKLPVCYINIGNFYKAAGKIDKAESFLLKTLNLMKELIEQQPEKFSKMGLVNAYYLLGNLYTDKKELEKAERYYQEIINIVDEQIDYANFDKVKILCLSKVELLKMLVKVFPNKFDIDLAETYKMLFSIFSSMGDAEKGFACCSKAIPIYEKLLKVDA